VGTRTVLATINRRPQGGLDAPERMDALMEDTEFWVRRATRMGARLIAFPEVYPQLCHPGEGMYEYVEPAGGGTLERVADLARKYDVDIVWPRFERDEVGIRNVSLYVNRRGELAGRYCKMFPTLGEMDRGVVPGAEAVCVEADFGRVGFAVCFDLNFRELRDAWRPQKPDVIVFSSMYRGGVQLQEWALDLGAFVVSSCPTELGRIVDRGGRVLGVATYEALLVLPVNLNSVQLHMDYNWQKMDEILAKYGPRVRFDYYTQEARFVISADDVPVETIIEEFDLRRRDAYFAEARARRRQVLDEVGRGETCRGG